METTDQHSAEEFTKFILEDKDSKNLIQTLLTTKNAASACKILRSKFNDLSPEDLTIFTFLKAETSHAVKDLLDQIAFYKGIFTFKQLNTRKITEYKIKKILSELIDQKILFHITISNEQIYFLSPHIIEKLSKKDYLSEIKNNKTQLPYAKKTMTKEQLKKEVKNKFQSTNNFKEITFILCLSVLRADIFTFLEDILSKVPLQIKKEIQYSIEKHEDSETNVLLKVIPDLIIKVFRKHTELSLDKEIGKIKEFKDFISSGILSRNVFRQLSSKEIFGLNEDNYKYYLLKQQSKIIKNSTFLKIKENKARVSLKKSKKTYQYIQTLFDKSDKLKGLFEDSMYYTLLNDNSQSNYKSTNRKDSLKIQEILRKK